MTLKEWNAFNYNILGNTEWNICILNKSYKTADKIIDTVMKDHHAVELFGDYELKRVSGATVAGSSTIRILLWPPVKLSEKTPLSN